MESLHFPDEREELSWFFAGIGPSVGLRAAATDYGGGVYDDAAQDRAHAHRRGGSHRADCRRQHAVAVTLERSATAQVMWQAFVPFGAGRATWRLLGTFSAEGLCLLTLALSTQRLARIWNGVATTRRGPPRTGETEEAYDRRLTAPPTRVELVAFLEDEISDLPRGNHIPHDNRLSMVLDEAAATAADGLTRYAARRPEARHEQAAARDEERRRYLGAPKASIASLEMQIREGLV